MKFRTLLCFLMVLSMVLSISACGKEEDKKPNTVVTTNATEPVAQPTSADEPVISNYDVEKVKSIKVAVGTPYEEIIAMLPRELTVSLTGYEPEPSKELFKADFSSEEVFLKDWVLCDNDNVTTIKDGKYIVDGDSQVARAYLDYPEWTNCNFEETKNEYSNYVVKAVIRGTDETPFNYFGIIFRAQDITKTGSDGLNGMFVGIGMDGAQQMCIGYMTHSWNLISYVPMDYKANTDYTLEVVVYNNEFAVLLNGEKVFLYETNNFINGTVGIRTWRQSYECSEFSVRTLGPEDYEYFGGYSIERQLPITWSCSDYNPDLPAKYGFVGTADSDLITSGVAATKVIVTVDENAVNSVDSANEPVDSDYEVQEVRGIYVPKGTPIEDIIAMLPSELEVVVPGENNTPSEVLFNADFTSWETFLNDFVSCDLDNVTDVHDGRYEVTGVSDRPKAYVDYREWSKYDPNSDEVSTEYANYAVKAVLRGTMDAPYNYFGVLVRASEIDPSGSDTHVALFIGLGQQLCIGYSMGGWVPIYYYDIDYVPNQDYTLEVVCFNDRFAVYIDGLLMYEGDTQGFDNGTVALRTWRQLYQCSEFSVRTLGPDDYEVFGGYKEIKTLPVKWTCTDYDPDHPGKYGFVGTIESDVITEGTAATKVIVTVNK